MLTDDDLRQASLQLGPQVAVLRMPTLAEGTECAHWVAADGGTAAFVCAGNVGLWCPAPVAPSQALELAAALAACAAHLLAPDDGGGGRGG